MSIFRLLIILLSFSSEKLIKPISGIMLSNSTAALSSMNDLQCLTQMPLNELLRIQKNLHLMHAVSDFNSKMVGIEPTAPFTTRIELHSSDNITSDNIQPVPEARHIFRDYDLSQTAANAVLAAQQPSVASLSMPSDANNHYDHKRFGYGSFNTKFRTFPSTFSFFGTQIPRKFQ